MAMKTEFKEMTNAEAERYLKDGLYDNEFHRVVLIGYFPSLKGLAKSLYPNDDYSNDNVSEARQEWNKPTRPEAKVAAPRKEPDRFPEAILKVGIHDVMAYFHPGLSIQAFKEYIDAPSKMIQDIEDRIKFWIQMAQEAVRVYQLDPQKDCLPILLQRHIMYGKGSLIHTGTLGIAVRCIDKLARIQNMTEQGIDDHSDSIRDSQVDIFNYCVLAYLLITVDHEK